MDWNNPESGCLRGFCVCVLVSLAISKECVCVFSCECVHTAAALPRASSPPTKNWKLKPLGSPPPSTCLHLHSSHRGQVKVQRVCVCVDVCVLWGCPPAPCALTLSWLQKSSWTEISRATSQPLSSFNTLLSVCVRFCEFDGDARSQQKDAGRSRRDGAMSHKQASAGACVCAVSVTYCLFFCVFLCWRDGQLWVQLSHLLIFRPLPPHSHSHTHTLLSPQLRRSQRALSFVCAWIDCGMIGALRETWSGPLKIPLPASLWEPVTSHPVLMNEHCSPDRSFSWLISFLFFQH